MILKYQVVAGDFANAGKVSSTVKGLLKQLNIDPVDIKRIIVALYEAEVNMVAHSYGGEVVCEIDSQSASIIAHDQGPGIPDLNLAMSEGWSTATAEIREMGFGAGMGLPNIKKNCDALAIDTAANSQTRIEMRFHFQEPSHA